MFSKRLLRGPGRQHGGKESCDPRYLSRGEATAKACGKPNSVLSLDFKLEVSAGECHTWRGYFTGRR